MFLRASIFRNFVFILTTSVVLLAAGAFYLVQNNSEITRGANSDYNLVILSNEFQDIAHQVAVERGMTAGYLKSKSPALWDKIVQQRKTVDDTVRIASEQLSMLNTDIVPYSRNFDHVLKKCNPCRVFVLR